MPEPELLEWGHPEEGHPDFFLKLSLGGRCHRNLSLHEISKKIVGTSHVWQVEHLEKPIDMARPPIPWRLIDNSPIPASTPVGQTIGHPYHLGSIGFGLLGNNNYSGGHHA